jgi:hypothetical protein
MLFTDGAFVTIPDLEVVDGEVQKVATTQGIAMDALLARSISELGNEFIGKIQNFSGYLIGTGVNANHMAAVLNVSSTAINRPRALLNQIPVIEPNPTRTAFKRYAEYYCLRQIYRSVYRRLINDRYEKKMKMYEAEAQHAWGIVDRGGFPLVLNPLCAPGATLEYGAGIWSSANVTATAGGTQAAIVDYDVAITWCNLPAYVSPANQGNAESAGSAVITIAVAASTVISVSIASLTPPNGTIPVAIGSAPGIFSPMSATHWNIYVGAKGGILYLQNSSPIPVATLTSTLADAPVLSGHPINPGQPAQYDFTFFNMISRA